MNKTKKKALYPSILDLLWKTLLLHPGNLEKSSLDFPAHWKKSIGLCFRRQIKRLPPTHSPSATLYPDSCSSVGSCFSHSSAWNNCGCVMAKYQVKELVKWDKSKVVGCQCVCARHLYDALAFVAAVWPRGGPSAGAKPLLQGPRQEAYVLFRTVPCPNSTVSVQ